MNMDALVRMGSPPWSPSPDARDLDVWHEYDVPTAGTFVLGSEHVLFTVLGSADDRMTVWAYVALTPVDVQELDGRKFGSVGDLGRTVDSKFAGRAAVFAIADELRIWRWGPVDVTDSVVEGATGFLSAVRESLERQKAPDVQLEVKLAGVAAAKDELISA
jgi:hypothetical protein